MWRESSSSWQRRILRSNFWDVRSMTNFVYKIRRKTDGLFSTGGTYPTFSKKGKTWTARGHVTSHLSQFGDRKKEQYYKDCEVVRIEIQEVDADVTDVFEWSQSESTIRAKDLKEQRRIEREKERKLEDIARLEKQLAKLRNEK
jgi:hypothetical protein